MSASTLTGTLRPVNVAPITGQYNRYVIDNRNETERRGFEEFRRENSPQAQHRSGCLLCKTHPIFVSSEYRI